MRGMSAELISDFATGVALAKGPVASVALVVGLGATALWLSIG